MTDMTDIGHISDIAIARRYGVNISFSQIQIFVNVFFIIILCIILESCFVKFSNLLNRHSFYLYTFVSQFYYLTLKTKIYYLFILRKCKFLSIDVEDNEYYCRRRNRCSRKDAKDCPVLCWTQLLFPLKDMCNG